MKKTIEQAIPAILLAVLAENYALPRAAVQIESGQFGQGPQSVVRDDVFFDTAVKERAVRLLCARLEYLFQNSKSFRRGVLRKGDGGNAGVDYLRMFSIHWAVGLVQAHPLGRTLWDYEPSGEGLLFIEHQPAFTD